VSVGLLIITHGNIGQSLYDAAKHVMGSCPIRTQIISLHATDDRDAVEKKVSKTLNDLDTGMGVLILTDMYGATPSNIACLNESENVKILSGLNLPMLIRVMNYPSLTMAELATKAISGGQEGILCCQIQKAANAS